MPTITVTYKCNKRCFYCRIYRHTDPNPVLDDNRLSNLKRIFSKLKEEGEEILITGGEPGVMDQDFYDRFFSVTPMKITVFTNGLFFKRYHELYKDKVKRYIIHIIDDAEDEVPVVSNSRSSNYISNNPDDLVLTYIYIVMKSNINKLHYMSNRFKELDINVKLYESVDPSDPNALDENDLKRIKDICSEVDNLSLDYYSDVKIISEKQLKQRISMCRKFPFEMEMDLVNNSLYHCCNGKYHGIELTYDNFIEMYDGNIPDYVLDSFDCNKCELIKYQGDEFLKKMMKRFFKQRRLNDTKK